MGFRYTVPSSSTSSLTLWESKKRHHPLGDEIRNLLHLVNVEGDGAGFSVAVFVHEAFEVLFAAADDDDGAAFLDEAGGEGFAYAAGCADDEDFFVGEWHDDFYLVGNCAGS